MVTQLCYMVMVCPSHEDIVTVTCRLREAELMFQEDRVADADRLLRTVIRKYPTYAGQPMHVTSCHIVSKQAKSRKHKSALLCLSL